MNNGEWEKVTRNDPCTICAGSDWCRRSYDRNFHVCRRLNDGTGKTKKDCNGLEYHVHFKGSQSGQSFGSARSTYRKPPPIVEDVQPSAKSEELNLVHIAIIEVLKLEAQHREQLKKRGLTDVEIDKRQYRSMPSGDRQFLIDELLKRFSKDLLLKVPGFYLIGPGFLKFSTAPGLLLPALNLSAEIVAFLVRLDGPNPRPKYVWVSSLKKGGVGPGAPVHIPKYDNEKESRARVTEGLLKSDIATALSSTLTLGLPGLGSKQLLPILKRMKIKTVVFAMDGDAIKNRQVAMALQKSSMDARQAGLEIEVETWDFQYKGIDDVLFAKSEIICHKGADATRVIVEIVAAAVKSDPTPREAALNAARKLVTDAVGKIKDDPGIVMAQEILRALLLIKVEDSASWARFRAAVKGKVSLRDLDKELNKEEWNIHNESRAKAGDDESSSGPTDAVGDNGQNDNGTPKGYALYETKNNCIVWNKKTKDGCVPVPLANFIAKIDSEEIIDDGIELRKNFVVSGVLANGNPLPKARVPAEQFSSMVWVLNVWGVRAVASAGVGIKDHLRAAIQKLSGKVTVFTSYGHLGWRKIDDSWQYLFSGGAISASGLVRDINVDPGDGKLKSYQLPEPLTGEGLRLAITASLSILDLAPPRITYPILAATYLAPLGEARKIDFSVFVFGNTGIGKTEIVALAQAHYGKDFHAKNLPGNWTSTANSLESQAFVVKDGIYTIDDFSPQPNIQDANRLLQAAERLFRSQGNQSGRGRLDNKTRSRAERHPRGLIVSNGEDVPRGSSLRARMLILELENGDVNFKKLTPLQEQARSGLLSQAMSGYIQWLAGRMDQLKIDLPRDHQKLREELLSSKTHKRSPDMAASLELGLISFLEFANQSGVITLDEARRHYRNLREALIGAGESQKAFQASEDPVNRFLDLVGACISSGRNHVADAKTDSAPKEASLWGWQCESPVLVGDDSTSRDTFRPKGDRIGWLKDEELWLIPGPAYASAQKLATDQKTIISISEQTLWKQLYERKIITKPANENRFTQKRSVKAMRTHVLVFPNKNIIWDGGSATAASPDSS